LALKALSKFGLVSFLLQSFEIFRETLPQVLNGAHLSLANFSHTAIHFLILHFVVMVGNFEGFISFITEIKSWINKKLMKSSAHQTSLWALHYNLQIKSALLLNVQPAPFKLCFILPTESKGLLYNTRSF